MGYVIHSKPGCHFCEKAKVLLESEKMDFSETLYETQGQIDSFKAQGFTTFPQVYEDGVHIGGFRELVDHLEF